MSRRKKTDPTLNKPTQARMTKQEEQPSPAQPKKHDGSLTFTKVSSLLVQSVWDDILVHATKKISENGKNINSIKSKIDQINPPKNAEEITSYMELAINFKTSMSAVLSWVSVCINIVNEELQNNNLPEQDVPDFRDALRDISKELDLLFLKYPQESVLGITLCPDQKQFSETKARISEIISRMEAIQRENEEAEKDWGMAEQNAYERMVESSGQNVPVEEFLDWLDELQQGKEV